VGVVPAGDTLPGDLPRTSPSLDLVTDERGCVEYAPPFRTHARLVLPQGLEPTGGTLVPDTCRRADVVLPVSGRLALVVTFPAGTPGPSRLVLEHETEMAVPAPLVPRTVVELESSILVGGRTVARYVGWFRTDVSPRARLRPPAGEPRRVTLVPDRPTQVEIEG
jgi:hypothetical protein